MKITVNGNEVDLVTAVSIKELLHLQQVEMVDYVTVQLNDEFVSSEELETTFIKDGDTVEFLYFMGGGR